MEKNKKKAFNIKRDFFSFVLGLLFIAFIVVVCLKTGNFLLSAIKTVFDKYPTISVAIITGLLAFFSVPVGKYFENRYVIKNQIRSERQLVYIEFLDWLINNVLNNEISNNKNIVMELKNNQKKMVIYASDKVLKAWSELRAVAMESDKNKKGMNEHESSKYYLQYEAPKIENLILAIRKELGYRNKNIKQYDILKLYINDINKLIDA